MTWGISDRTASPKPEARTYWWHEGYQTEQLVQNLRLGLTDDMRDNISQYSLSRIWGWDFLLWSRMLTQLWHSVTHIVLWIYHINVNGHLDNCAVFYTLNYLWLEVIFVIWLTRVILKIFCCEHKYMDIVRYQFICFTDNTVHWNWDVKHATGMCNMPHTLLRYTLSLNFCEKKNC